MRGKEHLVLIRPYSDVLMLHLMHYADEIRSSKQIEHGAKTAIGATELKLAERLIGDLSKDKFEPDNFKDTYREKILKVAAQKAAGQEVTAPEAPKRGKVIDLMSALKDSLKSQKKRRPERQRRRGCARRSSRITGEGCAPRSTEFKAPAEPSPSTLVRTSQASTVGTMATPRGRLSFGVLCAEVAPLAQVEIYLEASDFRGGE